MTVLVNIRRVFFVLVEFNIYIYIYIVIVHNHFLSLYLLYGADMCTAFYLIFPNFYYNFFINFCKENAPF